MVDLYRKADLEGEWSFGGWSYECVTTDTQLRALLEKVARMPFLGFDTESDGPLLVQPKWTKAGRQKHKDFINMYRSTTVGYSVAFPDRTSYYVPINHRKHNAPYLPALQVLEVLCQRTGWAHNLQHELLALRMVVSASCAALRDSQVAAWLAGEHDGSGGYGLKELSKRHLGHEQLSFEAITGGNNFGVLDPTTPEATRYACEDAVAALLLGLHAEPIILNWGLKDWYLDVEMPFVHVLRHMTDTGIPLDREVAGRLGETLSKTAREAAIEFRKRFDADPASPKQLQSLYERGIWPTDGIKRGKTGWSTAAATMVDFVNLPEGEGRDAATMLQVIRESSKASSTYSTNLVVLADQYPDGRLHPSYHQTGTVTGRLSSSYPNGQNMPTRSEIAKSILQMFAAPEGLQFGSADYSQIELRVLAHFSGGTLAEGYKAGADVHQLTADKTGLSRSGGKTLNFAKIYGAGPKKLAQQIGSTVDEAKKFVKDYDKGMPEVNQTILRVVTAAYERGYVKTLAGRRGLFPQMPNRDRSMLKRKFQAVEAGELTMDDLFNAWSDERKAFNLVCQGGASDIVKKAMVDLWKHIPEAHKGGGALFSWGPFNLQAQIHDDIRWEMFSGDTASMELVRTTMEDAWPSLRVPLVADPKMGKTWRDLK